MMQLLLLITMVGCVASRSEPQEKPVTENATIVVNPKIKVGEIYENSDVNPEENEGLFQGDIKLENPDMQLHDIYNAMRNRSKRWPNGIVYYKISPDYTPTKRDGIIQAMREIESNTKNGSRYCIRYVERTNQNDYIDIVPKLGCWSFLGREGGRQELGIGPGCHRKGRIMHELIHALGFVHEQCRDDRDQYVDIHTDNILTHELGNFYKFSSKLIDDLGTTYDFGSIMGYEPYAFAFDLAKPTITPKPGQGLGITMGQREEMSSQDTLVIQKYYECPIDLGHISHPPAVSYVVNCNFDFGLCGLTPDGGNMQWTRKSGATPTNNTGPYADHTNGGGYYIYAEADGNLHKKARLKTKDFVKGVYCVDFYLYQHGLNEGKFQILWAGDGVPEEMVIKFSGNFYSEWRHFFFNVITPSTMHFILEATIGSSPLSDIAIDDFKLYHGYCNSSHLL